MAGRGAWSERPPGTEDDFSESYGFSHNQHLTQESKRCTSPTVPDRSFRGEQLVKSHGSLKRAERAQRSRSRENYSRNRSNRRTRSKSPKGSAKLSKSPSPRSKFSRRNRRPSSSPSSSNHNRSSRSSSRGKIIKHRKRSRSRTRTAPKDTDRSKRKIWNRRNRSSSTSSSCSTDSSNYKKRKFSGRRDSPEKKARNFTSESNYKSRRNQSSSHYRKKSRDRVGMARNQDRVIYNNMDNPKPQGPVVTPFKNDGSFLEMFKKMQEAQKSESETASLSNEASTSTPTQGDQIKKPAVPFVGKRRGGRVLKTGMVKKAKTIEEQTVDNNPTDAWSLYLKEVKKYRETSCEEEGKTRPLVK